MKYRHQTNLNRGLFSSLLHICSLTLMTLNRYKRCKIFQLWPIAFVYLTPCSCTYSIFKCLRHLELIWGRPEDIPWYLWYPILSKCLGFCAGFFVFFTSRCQIILRQLWLRLWIHTRIRKDGSRLTRVQKIWRSLAAWCVS